MPPNDPDGAVAGGGNMVAPVSQARRMVSSASVIIAASIFGLTYGLTAPLIAVDLAERGATEWLIGLNATMHAVGVLIIAPLLPSLAVRFGPRGLIVAALALSAIVLAAFPYMPAVWLWFPLRLLLLHSKTALVDGVWATVGSTNLDWRSFLHNYELNGRAGHGIRRPGAGDVRQGPRGLRSGDARAMAAPRARFAREGDLRRMWEYWL